MTGDLVGRLDHHRVCELAAELIEIEGHEDLPLHEQPVALWLADRLRHLLPPERARVRLEPVPGGDRWNVVASVPGSAPGRTLMLNAHLDTVPGYGMPEAYRPTIRDGRLYGRGAVDMKGALAAMVAVVDILAAEDIDFSGELLLTAVAGEESGSPGMLALTQSGLGADFAVVGEPTGMRIATSHKGAMWIEALFHGLATHGSVPDQGVNAIYHAARFVTAVEERMVPRLGARSHPLLGTPTVSVGVVHGGDRPPMVPAECRVQSDRRWLPEEDHDEVLGEFADLVRELKTVDPRVEVEIFEMDGTGTFVHAPLDCPADSPGLRDLQAAVRARTTCPADPIGVSFWTDGALLAAGTGTPTVVCGPGDIAQAHSMDEWVELDQLQAAAEVYLDLACRFLGAEQVR